MSKLSDDLAGRQRKRPRVATSEMDVFEPKFQPVVCSNVNQSLATGIPDAAHIMASMMLRYNRETFLADVQGKLSWANGAPVAIPANKSAI